MNQRTRFVGLDVHKRTIVVAVAAAGNTGKAVQFGTLANTPDALEHLVQRLRETAPAPLSFCYEAGPGGYGVYRTLTRLDQQSMVVAPSLIPRKSGERRKTGKRDAANLAVLLHSGLLIAVWVPDAAHEAMRGLIRAPGRRCARCAPSGERRRLGGITKTGEIARGTIRRRACRGRPYLEKPAPPVPNARHTTGGLPVAEPLAQRRTYFIRHARPGVASTWSGYVRTAP